MNSVQATMLNVPSLPLNRPNVNVPTHVLKASAHLQQFTKQNFKDSNSQLLTNMNTNGSQKEQFLFVFVACYGSSHDSSSLINRRKN